MSGLRHAVRDLSEEVFVDVLDGDDAYLFVLDVSGTTPETVDVAVEAGRLRIEGSRRKATPDGFAYVREDRSAFVDVTLPLPPDAVPAEAAAALDRGVLEVEVPRDGDRVDGVAVDAVRDAGRTDGDDAATGDGADNGDAGSGE